MTKVEISYGSGTLEFELPSKVTAGKLDAKMGGGECSKICSLEPAPGSKPLPALVKDKRVLVLVDDYTRSEPHEEITDTIAKGIRGCAKADFVVATGSHDPGLEKNAKVVDVIKSAIQRYDLDATWQIHSGYEDRWTEMGETKRGTKVEVNPLADEAEVFVVGADMKPHYFAGYSCAVKDFMPGICSFRSIEMNHSHALEDKAVAGLHPYHPDHKRRENPVAEDMVESMNMIASGRPMFTLSTVSSKQVLWSGAGSVPDVGRAGIEYIDENMARKVGRRYPYIVISPGGYPQDESLYNAQRCLDLAAGAFSKGAKILLLAQCKYGIAPTEKAKTFFYQPLKQGPERAMASIEKEYKLYTHKAYRLANTLINHEVYIHSALEDRDVGAIGLKPVKDPQSLLEKWSKNAEADGEKILFVDSGNKLMITS